MALTRRLLLPVLLLSATLASAQEQRDLLSLVPSSARVVGGINVVQAKGSPFGQYLLSQMRDDDANFRRFLELTGFDPRQDLLEVLVASPGPVAGQTTRNKDGVVLARANYVPQRVLAAARQEGATVRAYRGIDLIAPPAGGNGSAGVVALVAGQYVVAGTETLVQASLDRYLGGSATLEQELTQRVAEVRPGNDAWFVSLVPTSALTVPGVAPNQQASALRAVQQAHGSVRLGTVVQMSAVAVTRSPQDATALVDVITFAASLLRGQAGNAGPQAPLVQEFLKSLDVAAAGSSVRLSASVPETVLEQLLRPRRAGRAKAVALR